MKTERFFYFLPWVTLIHLASLGVAHADDRVYRCGNEYTNNVSDAQARGCKLVQGGNVTVVQGTRAANPTSAPVARSSASNGARVEASEQRARDADARAILEAELRKSQARLAELHAEYNNGEPERQGGEGRNYQKYLDRVADLKANITRSESDIDGIKRELSRLPGASQ